jgi:uncharacterized protein YjbJ (UPF0337 family)
LVYLPSLKGILQMAGTTDKVKGAVKDTIGSATGNTRMQAEGKMDKAKGHAKDIADRVDKGPHEVSEAAKGVKDSLKK